jgi:hypothetical protein
MGSSKYKMGIPKTSSTINNSYKLIGKSCQPYRDVPDTVLPDTG